MGNDNSESDLDSNRYLNVSYREFSRPSEHVKRELEGPNDDWIQITKQRRQDELTARKILQEIEQMTDSVAKRDWKEQYKQNNMTECPECGDGFLENNDEVVEADDGELYCSLACLNESLN